MSGVVRTTYPEEGMIQAQWPDLVAADATSGIQAAQLGRYACKSVQVTGTFDGATVAIHGSNDGATYYPLSDPGAGEAGEDVPISFTSGGIMEISPNTRFIKPVLTLATAGSASFGATVTIIGIR